MRNSDMWEMTIPQNIPRYFPHSMMFYAIWSPTHTQDVIPLPQISSIIDKMRLTYTLHVCSKHVSIRFHWINPKTQMLTKSINKHKPLKERRGGYLIETLWVLRCNFHIGSMHGSNWCHKYTWQISFPKTTILCAGIIWSVTMTWLTSLHVHTRGAWV